MTNTEIPRNYLVMACRHSALLGLLSALGALGRRFESCRPRLNQNQVIIASYPDSLFYCFYLLAHSSQQIEKTNFSYCNKKINLN